LARDPVRNSSRRPKGKDGYKDGLSLYRAYFIPYGVDPTGLDGLVAEAGSIALNSAGCGAYSWPATFKLVGEHSAGFVVQEITVERRVYSCDGTLTERDDRHFWEFFPMPAGEDTSTSDPDVYTLGGQGCCTKGYEITKGRARFIGGLRSDVTSDIGALGPTEGSGASPAIDVSPERRWRPIEEPNDGESGYPWTEQSNIVTHDLHIKWDCCSQKDNITPCANGERWRNYTVVVSSAPVVGAVRMAAGDR